MLVPVLLLGGCSSGADRVPAPPVASPSSGAPTSGTEPRREPIPRDLRQLASAFIDYALGRADTLPTAETVTIGLDGRRLVSVDDMPQALSDREIWKVCPSGAAYFSAFSCPLDILGPLRSARRNRAPLVLTRDAEVLCARPGIPAPRGRFVVVRPTGDLVSCAFDFALVLRADGRGRLTEALMTVSEP